MPTLLAFVPTDQPFRYTKGYGYYELSAGVVGNMAGCRSELTLALPNGEIVARNVSAFGMKAGDGVAVEEGDGRRTSVRCFGTTGVAFLTDLSSHFAGVLAALLGRHNAPRLGLKLHSQNRSSIVRDRMVACRGGRERLAVDLFTQFDVSHVSLAAGSAAEPGSFCEILSSGVGPHAGNRRERV